MQKLSPGLARPMKNLAFPRSANTSTRGQAWEIAGPTRNKTCSPAGLAGNKRQPNKSLLIWQALHAWCEPGCRDPKTNHTKQLKWPDAHIPLIASSRLPLVPSLYRCSFLDFYLLQLTTEAVQYIMRHIRRMENDWVIGTCPPLGCV